MTEEEKRKQKRKITNYIVYSIVALVAVMSIYFIFSPTKENTQRGELNSALPEAEDENMPSDKGKAYEELAHEQLISKQMQGLGLDDLDLVLSPETDDLTLDVAPKSQTKNEDEFIHAATAANKAVSGLRQTQTSTAAKGSSNGNDSENEELRRKLEDEKAAREVAERMLAAHERMANALNPVPEAAEQAEQKERTIDIKDVAPPVVMPINSMEGVATSLNRQGRRTGRFHGIGNTPAQKNTIKASVYGRQVISDGQHVRLRLSEPMIVAGQVLPVGSVLVGTGKIGIDRLFISIHSVEFQDVITQVALEVFDTDGQHGIFLPGSMENEAGREIGADVATAVGSSTSSNFSMISNQPSAAEQIKADVGRGIIQGTFNYIGKKLNQIKVTIQDKHMVYLVPQKQ